MDPLTSKSYNFFSGRMIDLLEVTDTCATQRFVFSTVVYILFDWSGDVDSRMLDSFSWKDASEHKWNDLLDEVVHYTSVFMNVSNVHFKD